MLFKMLKYGGPDDGADVLGDAVTLDNSHVRFSLIYGEASPDPEHAKDPSALVAGEYTLGRARDNTIYKVLAVAEAEATR